MPELRGDGSIDPMAAAEDDLNPIPTGPGQTGGRDHLAEAEEDVKPAVRPSPLDEAEEDLNPHGEQ